MNDLRFIIQSNPDTASTILRKCCSNKYFRYRLLNGGIKYFCFFLKTCWIFGCVPVDVVNDIDDVFVERLYNDVYYEKNIKIINDVLTAFKLRRIQEKLGKYIKEKNYEIINQVDLGNIRNSEKYYIEGVTEEERRKFSEEYITWKKEQKFKK